MRDYGKVFTSIWASPGFRSLSEDGRALVLYLLTCPHGTITGTFRMPDGYVCEDLQWTSARVAKGFAELLANGFANRCETTKLVWVCKFLEWNPPENPNQRKAAAKLISQIADQCSWKRAFMRVCGPPLGIEAPQEDEPLSNPFETLSKPGTGTEAGTEEISEANASSSAGLTDAAATPIPKSAIPPCPHETLIELFHEVLPELPRVRLKTADRQKALAKLWRWVQTSRRPDGLRRAEDSASGVEWFRLYFGQVRDNDFLMGRTPRSGPHAKWACTLDYLLTDRGMKQVIERTYDNEAAA